jgi:hypothetical protein
MTDKILDKAHDYARDHIERTEEGGYDIIEEMRLVDTYLAGAEDNIPQWHYPSQGELPEDYRLILLCYKNGDAKLGYYDEVFADWKNKYDDPVAYPYAWQYIEPPKEV